MTTSLKTCFKCGVEKPLAEFYRHNQMSDGHLNKCKSCTKQDANRHRKSNIEKVRVYDRNRGNRQSPEYLAEYRMKNKEKYKAHSAVNSAVKRGVLKNPNRCSSCSSTNHIEAHHPDYTKPLLVIWLCSACHSQLHALTNVVQREIKKQEGYR